MLELHHKNDLTKLSLEDITPKMVEDGSRVIVLGGYRNTVGAFPEVVAARAAVLETTDLAPWYALCDLVRTLLTTSVTSRDLLVTEAQEAKEQLAMSFARAAYAVLHQGVIVDMDSIDDYYASGLATAIIAEADWTEPLPHVKRNLLAQGEQCEALMTTLRSARIPWVFQTTNSSHAFRREYEPGEFERTMR
jgi:hypothetical protein